ncbi:amidohydrolase family protein [Nonomuraea sp. NPDC050783]|uniref:amidohydrolase family protein n=1 Tax=Nonomuraea sp. NPDC050783 TaxID=3154634 RepID=UPI003465C5B8
MRVFDGMRLGEPRTVVIDGALIGDDPEGAEEIDAAGAALLPGLIDAHVHLHGPEDLATLAAWGVTTGLDMACWPAERVTALRRAAGVADFRTAGLPAIGPGGHHARMPAMPPEAVILTAADARRHVEARVAEGADYIKGVAEAPGEGGPPADALRALVEAARGHGLKTVVHAATPGAYTVAVESGAEFVTHTPITGGIGAHALAAMRSAGQRSIPTITMTEALLTALLTSTPPPGRAGRLEEVLADVGRLHRAGVEILAGTDANAEPSAPLPVPHGESLHHEFELMARAGMTPVEILRSATVLPAHAFGLPDRGAVRPGMRADLLLVDGDPTRDITATRAIRAVWCAGHPVTPATPSHRPPRHAGHRVKPDLDPGARPVTRA